MAEYEMRAMTEEEDKYTFSQSPQISSQTGFIGYLRADMDTNGKGFFSTWNDWRKDLKTQEFKDEFDEVINSLREEGDILHNRATLSKYCYSTPQARQNNEITVKIVQKASQQSAFFCFRFHVNIPVFPDTVRHARHNAGPVCNV